MSYRDELTNAMTWLSQKPDTIFLGQNIVYGGNALYDTLAHVPLEKRIELPVAEEMQMGMSIGIALTGKAVISIYPRFDFLLLAMNQLVNHLDKLEEFTNGQFHARVVIRVGIGRTEPLYPGVQHCGDYTEAFRKLLRNIPVFRLGSAQTIQQVYELCYVRPGSSLVVEDVKLYGME